MVEHQMNLQNIQVIRGYAHFIPKVRVDSNQIKQVFINIFVNAAEAIQIQDGGTITITTRTGLDKDGEQYVEIALTDTGTGIPEGTGLGLSVTKGIIDRHQGSIAINGEEGAGTTVIVTLPCNPSEKGDALNG
jgi:two-component system NtrC family sensor kinase